MPALYTRAGLFWCAVLPDDARLRLLCNDRYAMRGRKAPLPAFGIGAGFESPAALRRLTNQDEPFTRWHCAGAF